MINTANIVGALQGVPLFQDLNDRQLNRLAQRFVERDYEAGQTIVIQDQGGEGIFIIVSGKAEAVRARSDGERVVVNTFGPATFFGELALLDKGLRTATITAVEPTRCLALRREDFIGLLKEDAEMAVSVLQELAKRFRMALERL